MLRSSHYTVVSSQTDHEQEVLCILKQSEQDLLDRDPELFWCLYQSLRGGTRRQRHADQRK